MEIPNGAHPAPDDAMPDAEVLARATAFDPLAIMPELQRIKDAKLSPEETLVLQAEAALAQYRQAMCFGTNREAIMRLALQMIVAQCGNVVEDPAMRLDRCGIAARQALRECGQ